MCRQRLGPVAVLTLLAAGCPTRPIDPPQALQRGWEHFEFYDYPAAQGAFTDALKSDDPDLQAEALYGLAATWQHRQPHTGSTFAQAEALYERLLREHPSSRFVPWARLALVRLTELHPDRPPAERTAEARARYEALLQADLPPEVQDEATLRYGQSYTTSADPRDVRRGVGRLEAWLARRPDSPLAGTVHLVLADAYCFALEEPALAVQHYVAADRHGILNHRQLGDYYWRIAYLAHHRTGDQATARRYYGKLVHELFRDPRAYAARLALEQLAAVQTRPAPEEPRTP